MRLMLTASILAVFGVATTHSGLVFVDDDAPNGGNGLTWPTAFNDLQDALLSADPSADKILIAVGTYAPAGPNGSPSISFVMRNHLDVIGGFAADPNEPNRIESDGLTILTGDLNRNDAAAQLDDPNRSENSWHVLDCRAITRACDPNSEPNGAGGMLSAQP